jgi:hypothetical protein
MHTRKRGEHGKIIITAMPTGRKNYDRENMGKKFYYTKLKLKLQCNRLKK